MTKERRFLGFLVVCLMTVSAMPALAMDANDAELFLRARFAAEDEQLEEALEIFDELLSEHEENPVLYFEKARVLANMRRFVQAEAQLRHALDLDPSFYDARKLLGRMLLDRSAGRTARVEEAIEHLQIAFQLQPNDLATGLTISQVLLGLGKVEEAKIIVEGLLERTPDHRSVNYQYAQVLLRLGEKEKAAKYLEAVILQEPFYRPAITQLLEIYEEQGRWSEAADLLKMLAIQEPGNLEIRRQHAYFLMRAGRLEESRELLESILDSTPRDAASSFMLAEVLSELAEYEEAEPHYRRALLVRPDDPELLISFGLNQLALDDLDTAAAQFERLLELDRVPPRARALAATQLAAIDHERGDYDAALARARGVLETDGILNMQAVNITLDVLKRKEAYRRALDILDRLLRGKDEAPVLKARKIEFLALSGKDRSAWKIAEEQARRNLAAGLTAAQIYGQMERYDDSLRVLEEIDQRWRDEIDYLFQLGAVYERTGRYEASEDVFRSILERDPGHAATLNYLGYMWADKGVNLDEAKELITEAVRQFPRNGAYVDSLGWVYYKLGRYDLAERHLLEAARLIPDDPTIQEHLGDLFVQTGDLERAMDRYSQALELDPEDENALLRKVRDLEEKLASRLDQ
ncbi:MAG: tetratricopeptide repeat protein [Thermoanaerobaculia bacterium]|nr:tetratricopeptide repeat protein [Thermoanaerobaculia bacterium]